MNVDTGPGAFTAHADNKAVCDDSLRELGLRRLVENGLWDLAPDITVVNQADWVRRTAIRNCFVGRVLAQDGNVADVLQLGHSRERGVGYAAGCVVCHRRKVEFRSDLGQDFGWPSYGLDACVGFAGTLRVIEFGVRFEL